MIEHLHGKWVLKTKDGSKTLGTHATREEAEAQERAVEASKHSDSIPVLHVDAVGPADLKGGATVTREGWLRARALLTRTGVFTYQHADGSTSRQLRTPEEVFHPDALKSFELVPIVDDHHIVDASNVRQFQIGSVGENLTQDGKYVKANVLITDQAAVTKIMSGEKAQLSCGYTSRVTPSTGIYNGEHYDSVQSEIRGNHVALCYQSRGGPELRVRLDSDPNCVVQIDPLPPYPNEGRTAMTKVTFDGIDFDVAEQTAQAFNKQIEKLAAEKDAKIAELTGENAKVSAKADSLDGELKKANESLKAAQDPTAFNAAVKARVELEKVAGQVLGSAVKLDSLDNHAVKVAVVEKLKGEKLTRNDPQYVDAAFDISVANASALSGRGTQVPAATVVTDSATPDSRASRKAMIAGLESFSNREPGAKLSDPEAVTK